MLGTPWYSKHAKKVGDWNVFLSGRWDWWPRLGFQVNRIIIKVELLWLAVYLNWGRARPPISEESFRELKASLPTDLEVLGRVLYARRGTKIGDYNTALFYRHRRLATLGFSIGRRLATADFLIGGFMLCRGRIVPNASHWLNQPRVVEE